MKQRPLSLLDVTCVGINAIVGSSIFLFPGRLAGHLGPASVFSFGLTGLLLLSVALCFAEASALFDQAGGPYLYAREAFGETVGYGIGWMCWVTLIVSWAAVANGIAVYLGYFGPAFAGKFIIKAIAAVVIVMMGVINYRGVKLGAWTSNFFTAAKLIPLGLFVLLGLPHVSAVNFTPFAPHGWRPMGAACFLAYFAFQGFENVPVPAGEVDRPQRSVPLAVMGSLLIAAVLYMLVQAVAVGVYPGLSGSQRPLADAAGLIMGSWGAAVIVLGAVFSTIGYNAGSALGGPRYLVALSEQSDLPPGFSALHARFGTPSRAVALTTVLTLACAIILDFDKLVDFSNIVVCAQYISTCAAIPWLRKRKVYPAGAFRMPGGWSIPLLGICATLWLGAQGGMAEVGWSFAILIFGFLLRWGARKTGLVVAATALTVALIVLPCHCFAQSLENLVLDGVSSPNLSALLNEISKEPHVAGSEADLRLARYIEGKFKEYGLEVQKSQYDVLLSYPQESSLELVKPTSATLVHLEGGELPPEAKASLTREDLMPWNAYAPSGEATASLVYANYGRPEDFEALTKLGIEIKGRIVIARYSHCYRGGKTLEAQKRGAAAILIYSDPAEDGYVRGDPIPKGSWGTSDHYQRGSNVYDFYVPGDPLTPGWASTKGAKRIKPEESRLLPKIPSLPLSYADASKILSALEGPAAPKGWQGGLPFTYHIGPGPAEVHLKVKNSREVRPIVNVLGFLRGSQEPEKLVFISSHHDAWTRGAVDDGIGTSVTLELARIFAKLSRLGVRPKRTLVFASWDAEEYTLTGSTEWGEEHAESLRKNAVAFLNIDAYQWGHEFSATAVPSLRKLIFEALGRVPEPGSGRSLLEAWRTSKSEEPAEIGIMGSGSDYTVFLNHIGVPALETMFGGMAGVYHSIYDDYSWVADHTDPGFKYMSAIAKLNGFMIARLADSVLLPFDYAAYAHEIGSYLESLKKENHGINLDSAIEAAKSWEQIAVFPEVQKNFSQQQSGCANKFLMQIEKELLNESGVPDRPWFKHLIYAPRPSYEAISLPGIREALEAGNLSLAQKQALILEQALGRAGRAQKRAWRCLKD